MVKVEFLGPIGKDPIEVKANTLQDVAEVLQKDKDVNVWLENCAVAVNDEITRDVTKELKDGDRVSLLPPVCGG